MQNKTLPNISIETVLQLPIHLLKLLWDICFQTVMMPSFGHLSKTYVSCGRQFRIEERVHLFDTSKSWGYFNFDQKWYRFIIFLYVYVFECSDCSSSDSNEDDLNILNSLFYLFKFLLKIRHLVVLSFSFLIK